jgi:[acyl-carrier-protein] S-malonyltransferase
MNDSFTAVLFPGQGSQTDDMRSDVERLRPDLLERCAELVGEDPFPRVEEGTHFQQPAIFCASLAGWELLTDVSPIALAGHSMGELAALVAAGALDESDGLRLVTARGRLMQEAGERNGGGMLAVKGGREDVEELIEDSEVCLANDNAPEQVILSGPEAALEEVADELREQGVRSRPLPVSGAFHSPAMESAVEEFRAEVASADVREPSIPVVSSVTARPSPDIPDTLVAGLTSPVRWVETLHALHGRDIRRFVETGPGNVLTGLTGRTLEGVEALTASDLEPARG